MLCKLTGAVVLSLEAYLIEIEIEHRNGFPGFDIVGLADTAIKESKERVTQSIKHSGFDIQFRRVLCNLAPAHLKKTGTYLDVPIALGILASSGVISAHQFKETLVVGELGFDGQIRSINGALSIVLMAKKEGYKSIIVPFDNHHEVSIIDGIDIFPVKNLNEAIKALKGEIPPLSYTPIDLDDELFDVDFQEVKGQRFAKRALEIAAAGFHNVLLIGSPGVGKSMMAKRLSSIMPPLSKEESIEITQIYSASPNKGNYTGGLITKRPLRAPHHSASDVSIAGGGSIPKPGEISLAHHGILFLDEFPEFKRTVFEVLREPLEDHIITISRTEKVQQFPAHFLLIAAMNPCPCGYAFHPIQSCHCTTHKITQYYHRVSGPILDRIDIQVQMNESRFSDLESKEESSKTIRERVLKAAKIQKNRFSKPQFNSQMDPKEVEKYCQLNEESKSILKQTMEKMLLSLRAHHKILKIARTIADLENSINIETQHLLEAIQYRNIEKRFS